MAYIDKIHHPYALNNPVTIYDEESLTALELVARLAGKINEVVKAYNALDEETRQHLTEQDKAIMEGLATLTQQLPPYVSEWLEQHPEITTSLQDGEIMLEKLHETLKHRVKNGYVIPEMFGTVGEGDDGPAIQAALDNADGLPVLLAHDYTIKTTIWMMEYQHLIVDANLFIDAAVNGIFIRGMGNKVSGSGCIKPTQGFYRKANGIALVAQEGDYCYYNEITVNEVRDCFFGVQIGNYATSGETYFNKVDGCTFVDCGIGLYMYGYANGNKLGNLTFYGCGTPNFPTEGAITLNGTEADGYPIENMFYNISTTNANNCSSIGIGYKCQYNNFSGMQFENGGDNAYGFCCANPENFTNNTICGLSDINNQGSIKGKNNTWLMSYTGKNEMPSIKTREHFRPCGFKYALKKDSTATAFADGTAYTVVKIGLPPYAVANINLRGMLVSSAAGDVATGNTANLIVRAKGDGSIVPYKDGAFDIMSDGWINYTTPDAGVGVAHYTTCFVEMDVITTTRDTSQSMTPGHYGVTITPYTTFKEYKGDW